MKFTSVAAGVGTGAILDSAFPDDKPLFPLAFSGAMLAATLTDADEFRDIGFATGVIAGTAATALLRYIRAQRLKNAIPIE